MTTLTTERLLLRDWVATDDPVAVTLRIFADKAVSQFYPPSFQNITTKEAAEHWLKERKQEPGRTFLVEERKTSQLIGFFGVLPYETPVQKSSSATPSASADAKTASAAASDGTADASASATSATAAAASSAEAEPTFELDFTTLEIAYLFERSAWGKGFATEAAVAAVDYCFKQYKAPLRKGESVGRSCVEVRGNTDPRNAASIKVLQKVGMQLNKQLSTDKKSVYFLTAKDYNSRSLNSRSAVTAGAPAAAE